jgi:hypothetical protein
MARVGMAGVGMAICSSVVRGICAGSKAKIHENI